MAASKADPMPEALVDEKKVDGAEDEEDEEEEVGASESRASITDS